MAWENYPLTGITTGTVSNTSYWTTVPYQSTTEWRNISGMSYNATITMKSNGTINPLTVGFIYGDEKCGIKIAEYLPNGQGPSGKGYVKVVFYFNNQNVGECVNQVFGDSSVTNCGYSVMCGIDETNKVGTIFVLYYEGYGGKCNTTSMTNNSDGYNFAKRILTSISNGGGATHIAKVTGQLKDLSSNLSDILMVSGGGGGGLLVGDTDYSGKDAGGISGSGDNSADQSTGNAFGQGESGTNLSGGGSGLYGGYKGTSSKGGGAGSGYIGNSLLSNKKMVGYNVPTSDVVSTKTESVNVYSATGESNKPKAGDGKVKIKLVKNLEKITMTAFANEQFRLRETDTLPGVDSGSMTYDAESQSYYSSSGCYIFWGNIIEPLYLYADVVNRYSKFTFETVVKTTSNTVGYVNSGSNNADNEIIIGNWNYTHLRTISYSSSRVSSSYHNLVEVWTGQDSYSWDYNYEPPMNLSEYKNDFHRIKHIYTIENHKIKHVSVYVDNVLYSETDANTTLEFNNLNIGLFVVLVDHSYIKEVKVTLEE